MLPDSPVGSEDDSRPAGAPEQEIEITPEMIEAGLEWLYAYNPDTTDGKDTVRQIIRAALANYSPAYH
jgi:hypothetical protein